MNIIWRFIYIGYYIKKMNWPLLNKFIQYVKDKKGKSTIGIWFAMLFHSIKYKISLLEYFQFRFFEISDDEKSTWAGTGLMYEYQLKMNPIKQRDILDDKRKFAKSYTPYFVHLVADLDDLKQNAELINKLLLNPAGKLVFKVADGKCGADVEIKNCQEFTNNSLSDYLEKSEFDLVEEYIIQHPKLQALSPSAVNTVRIFTQLTADNQVEILGCRQRISLNSKVDNMAAGNMAAEIDGKTGIIIGPGVYSDITKKDEILHPVTGVSIIGFEVPFWIETLNLVKEAALLHPQNRSIGWDVVITTKGPGLIEGNHDWCKLLWQLPVKKGLKSLLKIS